MPKNYPKVLCQKSNLVTPNDSSTNEFHVLKTHSFLFKMEEMGGIWAENEMVRQYGVCRGAPILNLWNSNSSTIGPWVPYGSGYSWPKHTNCI